MSIAPPTDLAPDHAAAEVDQRRSIHVGTVGSLRRYPIKSLRGEMLAALALDGRGVVGDRLYAVRDGEDKFGSGKTTRRFRRMGGLFALRATYRDAVPIVTFPDRSELADEDPLLAERLSTLLGRPVTIAREAAISHFDAGAVHLLTTASLRAISAMLPGGPRTSGDSARTSSWTCPARASWRMRG
jgi:hypothetical protein